MASKAYDADKYRALWAAKVAECRDQRVRLWKNEAALRAAVEFFGSAASQDVAAKSAMLTALRALLGRPHGR